MASKKTFKNERHPDGGFTQTKTETYYVVRFCRPGKNNPRMDSLYYLSDKNRGSYGKKKRRRWDIRASDWGAYRFETRGEAMKGVRARIVVDWLKLNHTMLTEIVKIVETEIKSKTQEVEARPGCNPLLALALEAE